MVQKKDSLTVQLIPSAFFRMLRRSGVVGALVGLLALKVLPVKCFYTCWVK